MPDIQIPTIAASAPSGGDTVLGVQGGAVKRLAAGPSFGQLAADAGAELVGFLQAGDGAVPRTMRGKAAECISLLDFIPRNEHAAIIAGTSTYDCTTDIAAWIAAIPQHGVGIAPYGVYVANQVVIDARDFREIRFNGTLKKNVTGGVQIKNCRNSRFFFHWIDGGVYSGAQLDYNALTGAAMEVISCSNCDFEFGRGSGFQYGWRIQDNNGNGVYFCRFKWSSIQYVKRGVDLSVISGVVGFANGNTWLGGDIRCGETAFKTTRGASQTDPFNGNKLIGVEIEGAIDAFDLDFAHNNQIIGTRIEGGVGAITGRWLKTGASCRGNTYMLNVFPLDKLEINCQSARLIGPIMNTLTGVAYGAHAYTDQSGGAIHVWAHKDSGSIVSASNGVAVKTYILNADEGVAASVDRGVTALKIADASGTKRVSFRIDGQVDANNADADLPYCVSVVMVQSNAATVKLRLKTSDYHAGRVFYVDVTSYANSITIRNETDTGDIVPAGAINSVGVWMVYVTSGLGVRVRKLS